MGEQMLDLASKPSPDPSDLEQFGGTWHWGDQEMLKVVFTQLSQQWNYLEWEYDLPVGLCGCEERRTKEVYSYHFVCANSFQKPWLRGTTLYEPFVPECELEIFHLWFRMFAKATNSHILPQNQTPM